MTLKPEFPTFVDSSMLSYLKSCPTKFFYAYMLHMKPQRESVHLLAGGAFAKGLEVARRAFYERNESEDQALVEGAAALISHWGEFQPEDKSKKQLDVMLGALFDYFIEYPMEKDHIQPYRFDGGKPAVEFSFAIPLPVLHPETGEKILFVGRLDLLGVLNGLIYGTDEKTATQLGAWWSQQWELRSQFSAYTWAVQEHGIPSRGVVVRGVGIMANEFKHAEVICERPAWMLKEWYAQIIRDLERLKSMWAEGVYDMDLADSCSAFGGCPYRGVCGTSPAHRESALRMEFTRKIWNPIEGTETAEDEE